MARNTGMLEGEQRLRTSVVVQPSLFTTSQGATSTVGCIWDPLTRSEQGPSVM